MKQCRLDLEHYPDAEIEPWAQHGMGQIRAGRGERSDADELPGPRIWGKTNHIQLLRFRPDHRTLNTPFVGEWVDRANETQGPRSDDSPVGRTVVGGLETPVQHFASLPPNAHTTGDIESMSLLAGQSVGLVSAIQPAADIIRGMVDAAQRLIKQLRSLIP